MPTSGSMAFRDCFELLACRRSDHTAGTPLSNRRLNGTGLIYFWGKRANFDLNHNDDNGFIGLGANSNENFIYSARSSSISGPLAALRTDPYTLCTLRQNLYIVDSTLVAL